MNRGFHDNLDDTQPCLDYPALFFPKQGEHGDIARAKAICRTCSFQPACLRYALAYDLYGIWGGSTRTERQKYQRERRISPIPVLVHGNARRPAASRTTK